MTRRQIAAAVFGMAILLALVSAPHADDAVQEPRLLTYKTMGDGTLKLHVFEPERADPAGAPKRPCILFFFGGGWMGGQPSQFYEHARHFARRGMVAACAEYRVQKIHGTPPFACVQDGKSAMRWIRSHADELGVDPKRIVAAGGSAGGHVAASTATLDGFNEEGEDTAVNCRPDALVLFNPVIDTTPGGYGHERLGDQTEAFSPAHHVKPGIPPTIIFHGTADTTVPFENVERFTRLMKEAGNACTLVPFEGEKHGFFNCSRSRPHFDTTIKASDDFLASLGFIEPQAKE